MTIALRPYPDKRCFRCRLFKHLDNFGTRVRNSDGKRSCCKECEKKDRAIYLSSSVGKEKSKLAAKKWYAENRDSEKERLKAWSFKNLAHLTLYRRKKLLSKYGISIERYNELILAQGNVCKICGSGYPGRGHKYFHVDHCHKTNFVRGLLCTYCNLAIGQFGDDPVKMRRAADYVENKGQL